MLPAAIRAGLLAVMVSAATRFGPEHIRYLLKKIFHNGLVYYHVVAETVDVLGDVKGACQEFKALGAFAIGLHSSTESNSVWG